MRNKTTSDNSVTRRASAEIFLIHHFQTSDEGIDGGHAEDGRGFCSEDVQEECSF